MHSLCKVSWLPGFFAAILKSLTNHWFTPNPEQLPFPYSLPAKFILEFFGFLTHLAQLAPFFLPNSKISNLSFEYHQFAAVLKPPTALK
jgi:hypothetical protein